MEDENTLTVTDSNDFQENSVNMENEEPAAENPLQPSPEDVGRLVAEAEQRGYMRGVNEQLSKLMEQPTLYEDLARRKNKSRSLPDESDEDPLTSRFLSDIQPGIWD